MQVFELLHDGQGGLVGACQPLDGVCQPVNLRLLADSGTEGSGKAADDSCRGDGIGGD